MKVVLFSLKESFREGMGDDEILEITRGVWEIDPARAEESEYAFGVFRGVARGVYTVDKFFPAGTLKYRFRPDSDVKIPGRWEFSGSAAPKEILAKYLGKPLPQSCRLYGPFRYAEL